MDITIKSDLLAAAMGMAEKAVPHKPVIPILAGARLSASALGTLEIATTDTEIALTLPIGVIARQPGALVLPAIKLREVAKILPGAEIAIAQNGTGATVAGAGFHMRLSAFEPADYPQLPDPGGALFQRLPRTVVKDLIARTRFAVSPTDGRYFLAGVWMELHPQAVRMVATDGHRLLVAEGRIPGPLTPIEFLLPSKAVDALAAMLDENNAPDVEFAQTEQHLFFRMDEMRLASRAIDGKFPDYARIMPKPESLPHAAELDRAAWVAALKRVALAAPEDRACVLTFTPGQLRLTARSHEIGEATDRVDATYAGPEITTSFNIGYLIEGLEACATERVTFGVGGELTPSLLQPVGGEIAYRCVVMPVRM